MSQFNAKSILPQNLWIFECGVLVQISGRFTICAKSCFFIFEGRTYTYAKHVTRPSAMPPYSWP